MLDLKVWYGSVWFSIDDLLKKNQRHFSWKSINLWRQEVIILAHFCGGFTLLGFGVAVWGKLEASITVEGTEFVIDSARAKEVSYDPYLKVGTLTTSWISKVGGVFFLEFFRWFLGFFFVGGKFLGVFLGGICEVHKLIQVTKVVLNVSLIINSGTTSNTENRIWRIYGKLDFSNFGVAVFHVFPTEPQFGPSWRHRPSSELAVQVTCHSGHFDFHHSTPGPDLCWTMLMSYQSPVSIAHTLIRSWTLDKAFSSFWMQISDYETAGCSKKFDQSRLCGFGKAPFLAGKVTPKL